MGFIVDENSSFALDVFLRNADGGPLHPIDSVTWWVGKPKSDVPIRPKQDISNPNPEFELIIPASANICSGRRDEDRFVVVRVQSGTEHLRHAWFEYTVEAKDTVPYPENNDE